MEWRDKGKWVVANLWFISKNVMPFSFHRLTCNDSATVSLKVTFCVSALSLQAAVTKALLVNQRLDFLYLLYCFFISWLYALFFVSLLMMLSYDLFPLYLMVMFVFLLLSSLVIRRLSVVVNRMLLLFLSIGRICGRSIRLTGGQTSYG